MYLGKFSDKSDVPGEKTKYKKIQKMYLGSREIRMSVPRNITLHAGVWGGDSSAAGAAKQYFNKTDSKAN